MKGACYTLDIQDGQCAGLLMLGDLVVAAGQTGEAVTLYADDEFARVLAERSRVGRLLTLAEADRAARPGVKLPPNCDGMDYTYSVNHGERFEWGVKA